MNLDRFPPGRNRYIDWDNLTREQEIAIDRADYERDLEMDRKAEKKWLTTPAVSVTVAADEKTIVQLPELPPAADQQKHKG